MSLGIKNLLQSEHLLIQSKWDLYVVHCSLASFARKSHVARTLSLHSKWVAIIKQITVIYKLTHFLHLTLPVPDIDSHKKNTK